MRKLSVAAATPPSTALLFHFLWDEFSPVQPIFRLCQQPTDNHCWFAKQQAPANCDEFTNNITKRDASCVKEHVLHMHAYIYTIYVWEFTW